MTSVVESISTKTVTLTAADVEAIPESEAGQPEGVATLNGGGKLPEAQLPSSVASESSTLAGLRKATAIEGHDYYLSEPGKEGWWKLEPADTTSADNMGTIIVTESGQRLYRVTTPEYGYAPEWFGAKGNWKDTTTTLGEGTDDTAAFQACANAIFAAGGGRMWLTKKVSA